MRSDVSSRNLPAASSGLNQDHHFRDTGEILPSKNKITCCFRRKDITLQRARDTKPKTIEERSYVAREHLFRLDEYYRGKSNNKKRDLVYRMERNFAFDGNSGVKFRKNKTTYNPKGSKSYHVRVPVNLGTRQLSVVPLFYFGTEQLPYIDAILPRQLKKISHEKKKLVGWDVFTQPASAQTLVEMEGLPKKVRVYFQKSGLWREPVTRQRGVDFEVYTRELIGEKLLQLDWYDSHCDPKFLTQMKAGAEPGRPGRGFAQNTKRCRSKSEYGLEVFSS